MKLTFNLLIICIGLLFCSCNKNGSDEDYFGKWELSQFSSNTTADVTYLDSIIFTEIFAFKATNIQATATFTKVEFILAGIVDMETSYISPGDNDFIKDLDVDISSTSQYMLDIENGTFTLVDPFEDIVYDIISFTDKLIVFEYSSTNTEIVDTDMIKTTEVLATIKLER